MARPYSTDLRERVVAAVTRRSIAARGGAALRRRRQHGGQLDAALACDRQRRAWPDGRASAQEDRRGMAERRETCWL